MDNCLTEPQRGVLDRLLRAQLLMLEQSFFTGREGLARRAHARAGLVQHPPDPAEDEPGYDARTHDALTDALRRLHGPDFGRCRGCEAEIPFERLVAKPQTTRCCCCETAIEHSA